MQPNKYRDVVILNRVITNQYTTVKEEVTNLYGIGVSCRGSLDTFALHFLHGTGKWRALFQNRASSLSLLFFLRGNTIHFPISIILFYRVVTMSVTNPSVRPKINIFSSFFLSSYIRIRLCLSVVWIKLSRIQSQPNFSLKTQLQTANKYKNNYVPKFHKAVIIGDGFAMGIGGIIPGSTGCAGIAPFLESLAVLDPSIRRPWKIINRGDLFSLTSDWLPSEPSSNNFSVTTSNLNKCEINNKYRYKRKLFNSTFHKSNCHDADIVIIIIGSSDIFFVSSKEKTVPLDLVIPPKALERDLECLSYPHEEISSIVKNIVHIALELQELGKRVCIVDFPTSGFSNVNVAGRGVMRRLNSQLKQYLKEMSRDTCQNSKYNKKADKRNERESISSPLKQYPIQLTSLGNNHRIMRTEHRSFDGLHLNKKGYKFLASEIFAGAVKAMMVNTEFESAWKYGLKKQK